jgi:glutaredoxin 3
MKKIRLYTAPQCKHSILARRLFDFKGVEYEEINVMLSKAGYEDMIALSHQSSVPVIEIGSHIFAGFDKRSILKALREA